MPTKNKQILLASRPHGEPTAENFRLVEIELPSPAPGQLLLRSIYLSLDPYMRGRMNEGKSYASPVEVGGVMGGQAVAEVVESNHPDHRVGEIVLAPIGWQEYALSDGDGLQEIDPSLGPISYALGVLGMPGLTAYTGLMNIGQPQPGETLVVAAASGAVGSVVGQIGKLKGCRVIGIAGGAEKCRYVKEELGFDDCLDHRAPHLADRLKAACPDGIDVYFENVGGPQLEVALLHMRDFGRVAICGWISQYNATSPEPGPSTLALAIPRRLRLEGFIVTDHLNERPNFFADMKQWIAEGKIRWHETVIEGLPNAPKAFIGLFAGQNIGKMLVRIGPDPAI